MENVKKKLKLKNEFEKYENRQEFIFCQNLKKKASWESEIELSDPSATQNQQKYDCRQHDVVKTLSEGEKTENMVTFFAIFLSPTDLANR